MTGGIPQCPSDIGPLWAQKTRCIVEFFATSPRGPELPIMPTIRRRELPPSASPHNKNENQPGVAISDRRADK
jgi:hypothetical protein